MKANAKATDLMFVLDRNGLPPEGGWVPLHLVAAIGGLLALIPAGRAGVWIAVALLVLAWLLAARTIADMLETLRDRDARDGRYAPPEAARAPGFLETGLFLLNWTIAPILTVLPYACWMAARERRAGVNESNCVLHASTVRRMLRLYLVYPDRRHSLVGGWFGVWAPRSSVANRHFRMLAVLAPCYFVAGLWLRLLLHTDDGLVRLVSVMGLSGSGFAGVASYWLLCAWLRPVVAELRSQQQEMLPPAETEWEHCVNLLAATSHQDNGIELRDHYLMGVLPPPQSDAEHPYRSTSAGVLPCGRPMLLHRSVVTQHSHFTGATRIGKTARGMCGLLTQLTRHPLLDDDEHPLAPSPSDGTRPDQEDGVAILNIDLKGDLALYHTHRLECLRAGRPFHAFTLEQGKQSSYFNAVETFEANGRPTVEFTELTVNALSLYWGSMYGRAYYSAQHRDLLLDALRSSPRPRSWAELYQRLLNTVDREKHRDVFELVSKVRVLAEYPQLGRAPAGTDVINMRQVIEEGHSVYLWLPAKVSAQSIRDVGKLALYAFLTEAGAAMLAGKRRRCFVFIDEVQCLTGDNLQVVFQQAASAGVTMVLANQSPQDLDSDSTSRLSQVVRSNTGWQAAFSIQDVDEMDKWIRGSGESCTYVASYTSGTSATPTGTSSTSSTSWKPVVHPTLDVNLIKQVNSSDGSALLQVHRDAGGMPMGGTPRRVWMPWPLTHREYQRRAKLPWPDAEPPPSQIPAPICPKAPTPTVSSGRTHSQVEDAALTEFAQLDELFRSLRLRSSPRRKP